jgi:NitT/TauT family transport system substrate-binding protein
MVRTKKIGWHLAVVFATLALIAAACGDTAETTTTTAAPGTTTTTAAPATTTTTAATGTTTTTTAPPESTTTTMAGEAVLTGAERCAANEEAGTITFLTGFGFFPSVSVAEVIAAEALGYFDEMCLDVDIEPSLPGEALVLVNANVVQFAATSYGPFAQAVQQGAERVIVVLNKGHFPIWTLVTLEEFGIDSLEDFAGTTIGSSSGVAGAPIRAMLAGVGLESGEDYDEAAIGFDPRVIGGGDIQGIAGFRSNQPETLRREGFNVIEFWPEEHGGVGSFGATMASTAFLEEHPTAAEDWIRATLHAWEWAIQPENHAQVVQFSADLTTGDLNTEHELFRWGTESGTALASTPEGWCMGATISDIPAREIAYMTEVGLLEGVPDVLAMFTNDFVERVYDDECNVIWPGPMGE